MGITTTGRQPPRQGDVLRRSLDLLTGRLPASWSSRVRLDVALRGGQADAVVDITGPDGQRGRLVVQARPVVEPRDVAGLAQQMAEIIGPPVPERPAVAVVVARYLAPPVRERLAGAGLGYADATGNMRVALDRPAVFLRDTGADRDPWRGPGRPRGDLKGANALRLVRALADFSPPFTVARLAELAGVSVGATYRMVEFLQREDLIGREPRAAITRCDWRGVVERWGEDVGTTATERMSLYLAPRGFPELLAGLQAAGDLRYVLTGTLAAGYYDEVVPPRLAVVYADPVEPVIERLGLRPSPAGNVLVGVPVDPVVFERPRDGASLRVAAPSQVAMDLLGGPGRGPSEAALLLDWMERNPGGWRRPG